jgi:hypothetical protein
MSSSLPLGIGTYVLPRTQTSGHDGERFASVLGSVTAGQDNPHPRWQMIRDQ